MAPAWFPTALVWRGLVKEGNAMVETREKTVAVAAVDQFRSMLRGELIGPADNGYEEARQVFNGMIDRHPQLILRCADVADVIHAVNFARENDLLLSVRGGGHNVSGFGTNQDGLVIDLSRMKGIRVDP